MLLIPHSHFLYLQSFDSTQRRHYKSAKLNGNLALCFSIAAVVWAFIGIIVGIGVVSQIFPRFCLCLFSKCVVYECGK